jgi:lysophospholipase L1-like esterase
MTTRRLRAGILVAGVAVVAATALTWQVPPAVPAPVAVPVPAAPVGTPGPQWLVTGPPSAAPSAPPSPSPSSSAPAPPLRIMPLGDSITFGSGSPSRSSYRAELYRRLVGAGLSVDFVGSVRSGTGADPDNEGHPGWRIGQIAEKVDGWLATYRPDVVLLHIGTNDMRTAERAAGATGRLSALIDRIHRARPEARIFVARLIGAGHPAVQARIDAYNAALPGIVAGKGSRVRLVDLSAVGGAGLADNLHPNDAGYARMAALWFRAVHPVLARPAR